MTSAGILLIFFILHLFTGALLPVSSGAAPVFFRMISRFGAVLEKRLNRDNRASGDLFFRGGLMAVMMAFFAFWVGTFIVMAGSYGSYGWVLQVAFLTVVVSIMPQIKAVQKIAKSLKEEDLNKKEGHARARHTVEQGALALQRHLVAPVFWFILFGMTGAVLYVTFSALRNGFTKGAPQQGYFSAMVYTIDEILNSVPGFLTLVIVMTASVIVAGANPLCAFRTAADRGLRYGGGVVGYVVAAVAGSLGITLGGPPYEWVGPKDSTAKISVPDMNRAAMLYFISYLCLIVMISATIMFVP